MALGARLDRRQRMEQSAQVHPPRPEAHLASAAAHHSERDPVPAAYRVLGQRGGGADREVEAARRSVHATRATVVGHGVDHQQDAGVLLGPGRGRVQPIGAAGDPPVDPAQPVAGLELPDPRELGTGARPRGAMRAHQAPGLRRLGAGGVRRRRGQHLHLQAGQGDRPPAVARPAGRERHPLVAQHPPPPAPGADLQDGEPVGHQSRDASLGRMRGDVRRLGHRPGDLFGVLGVGDPQPGRGALALVQRHVVDVRAQRRRTRRARRQAHRRTQDQRRDEHQPDRLTEEHRPADPEPGEDQGPAQCGGRSPLDLHGVSARSWCARGWPGSAPG